MHIFLPIFLVGLAGVLLLFFFKIFEIKRGTAFFSGIRSRTDRVLENIFSTLKNLLKRFKINVSLSELFHKIVHKMALVLSYVARFVAEKAESLAMRISSRRYRKSAGQKEASGFLQEMIKHKREKSASNKTDKEE